MGRERQCRRGSSAVPASSPSSHEATFPQIPHHVARTSKAYCHRLFARHRTNSLLVRHPINAVLVQQEDNLSIDEHVNGIGLGLEHVQGVGGGWETRESSGRW